MVKIINAKIIVSVSSYFFDLTKKYFHAAIESEMNITESHVSKG